MHVPTECSLFTKHFLLASNVILITFFMSSFSFWGVKIMFFTGGVFGAYSNFVRVNFYLFGKHVHLFWNDEKNCGDFFLLRG